MSFNVEITPRGDAKGAIVHAVIVTIDGHQTVLTFQSKEDADSFARAEQARLAEDEKYASQRVRELAYRLWQEEGCPQGEDLRHWFTAKALFVQGRPTTNEGWVKRPAWTPKERAQRASAENTERR